MTVQCSQNATRNKFYDFIVAVFSSFFTCIILRNMALKQINENSKNKRMGYVGYSVKVLANTDTH